MGTIVRRAITVTLALAALAMVGLAVVGGVQNYSPVPHWDMWPAYLDFYQKVSDGQWREWWAQHNEHRIVLARLLFWADLAWFEGRGALLIIVNYLLAAGIFLTFRAILRERAGPAWGTPAVLWVQLFMAAALFAWMQHENFTWGFQSQFFLAQWLPLLALWLLYRSREDTPRGRRDFSLSVLLGVLSVGTMASGILALPVLTACAALLRLGRRRVALLASLSVLTLVLYFIGYQSPPGHGSLGDALRHSPWLLARYVALYLGTPFFRISGERWIEVGQVFGFVLIALAVWKAVPALRRPREHAFELFLLAFIAYVGGTAFGTGAGRLLFGLQQATANRYTTPALMTWMAVLLLYLPALLRSLERLQVRTLAPAAVVLAALLVAQWPAKDSKRNIQFEKDVAALALELGVHDDQQVIHVMFHTGWGLDIAKVAAARDLSIFSMPWLKDAAVAMGQPAGPLPAGTCQGELSSAVEFADGPGFLRISGWIAAPDTGRAIEALRVVDAAGVVVGYARVGRKPKRQAPGLPDGAQAFRGYVRAAASHQPLRLAPKDAPCTLAATARPQPWLRYISFAETTGAMTIRTDDVITNTGWTGHDYQKTSPPAGMKVLGSFVGSDRDMGEVTLRMRRGSRFFWRSGPNVAHQTWRISAGERTLGGAMPRAHTWVGVVFDHPDLPETFTLTLTDGGSDWGEWSAIAVLDPAPRP